VSEFNPITFPAARVLGLQAALDGKEAAGAADAAVSAHVSESNPHAQYARMFVHAQPLPLSSWTVDHNLGAFPSVTTVDNSGQLMYGDVQFISANRVVISFTQPVVGFAYLG